VHGRARNGWGVAPAIVTVFSARMYGARSHKNKKLIEDVEKALAENVSSGV